MLDIVNAIEQEQRQRYQGARKSLFALLRRVLTWKKPDVEKAVSLCPEAKIDPKWLSFTAEMLKYEAGQAATAATLPERNAEEQHALADLQTAQQRHEEIVRQAEADLLAARQRLHAAKMQRSQASDAQAEAARIRADFSPLFNAEATDFANLRDVQQLPAALQGFARQIGLADHNGWLLVLADQETVAAQEAERRRQAEISWQQTVAARNAQRRAAMAAQPAMSKE